MKRSPFLGLFATCSVLAAPLLAHDDDPKILHRNGPTIGTGFSARLPGVGPGGVGNNPLGNGNGMTLLSWIPLNQIDGANAGNDCWGYTSPSGTEYAIVCTSSGTAFFSLADPTVPAQVGYVDGPNSTWRDVKVYQDHAYIVSEGGGGIQCVSMANIDAGSVVEVGTVTVGGTNSSHNVAIDEDSGYLYRCGGGNNVGLRIYDLNQSLSNPPFVGEWNTKYVHDAQIVTYTTGPLAGMEIAYCCSGFNNGGTNTGLSIVDVTNKSNITVMDEVFYPNPAYSHQGWLSEDRSRFHLGDELDENGTLTTTTHVINVVDPNNAFVENTYTNGNTAIGHNMYERDGYMFQANYTSGIRVFDLNANPTNPPEVAFYDTFPANDNDNFNGLWSCFVDYDSGIVLGMDIDAGMFVWFFGDPDLSIDLTAAAPAVISPSGGTVGVTIMENNAGTLVAGSEMLHYDIGAGSVSVPLQNTGGVNYNAVFPSLPCGTSISWYVSATSTNGFVFTNPASGEYSSLVAEGVTTVAMEDMEANNGWVGGQPGDTATTGNWERGDPQPTAAQTGDDHTPNGTDCWVTGLSGGNLGSNDVDGGFTTLLSANYDLTGLVDPQVSYWRWYSNDQGGNPGSDVFEIDISDNGGTTWTSLEVVGPSGAGTTGGWVQASFRVLDFVNLTSQVRLRFIAEDIGGGSIVEAAIDDLLIDDVDCGNGLFSRYCSPAIANSTGQPGAIDAMGSNVAADNDLTLMVSQLPSNQFGFFITSTTQGFVQQPGGSTGNLCLGGAIGRYNSQVFNSGAGGMGSLVLDLTSTPTPGMPVSVLAGETRNWQAWYRDSILGAPTSNFTDALSVSFQ